MRIFALPAALALSFMLYLPFPNVPKHLLSLLSALHNRMLPLFTFNDGKVDKPLAQGVLIFVIACAASALGAVHPLLAAVTTDYNDKPLEPVVIESVRVVEE